MFKRGIFVHYLLEHYISKKRSFENSKVQFDTSGKFNFKKYFFKLFSAIYVLNADIKYCSFQYLEVSYITLLTTKMQNEQRFFFKLIFNLLILKLQHLFFSAD